LALPAEVRQIEACHLAIERQPQQNLGSPLQVSEELVGKLQVIWP
jgi:hypothetical protein